MFIGWTLSVISALKFIAIHPIRERVLLPKRMCSRTREREMFTGTLSVTSALKFIAIHPRPRHKLPRNKSPRYKPRKGVPCLQQIVPRTPFLQQIVPRTPFLQHPHAGILPPCGGILPPCGATPLWGGILPPCPHMWGGILPPCGDRGVGYLHRYPHPLWGYPTIRALYGTIKALCIKCPNKGWALSAAGSRLVSDATAPFNVR